jgi:pSer/pThr/pTyr-binding forkhead associated (FHA) protein
MEPSAAPLPDPAGASPPAGGELVVQNGRLSGTRRPLSVPLTLIGRSAACDIRLQAEDVEPAHCALVHGPDGLLVRDLGGGGVLVNDTLVESVLLHDGDMLAVGPFHFTVHLPAVRHALDPLEREREALRIQAAAVVAQQAALTETEDRLEQRRLALERQEEQLAAHLEAKRGRLLDLQQRVRESRQVLKRERAEHAGHTASEAAALERQRQEIAADRQRVAEERRRLAQLNQRLQQRYQRQLERERAGLRRREDDLAARQRELGREAARLEQERAGLREDRLRWNGEVELGRRQLQAGWNELRGRQQRWQEEEGRRQAALQQGERDLQRRAAALAAGERDLAEQWQHWEDTRADLQREVQGLENRVRNGRLRLAEQEADRPRLAIAADQPAPVEVAETSTRRVPADGPSAEELLNLERLAADLADQRLQLAEECERLVLARQQWSAEHQGVLEELEAAGVRLQEREQDVALREEMLAPREFALAQREEESLQLRHRLEAGLARAAAQDVSWQCERQRFLEQVQAREALAERRWLALVVLRRRWAQRRRQELKRLRADIERCEEFRQQYAALWEECLRRQTELDHKDRELAAQALALEQQRLEHLGQTDDPAAATKQLAQLQRRWLAVGTEAQQNLRRQRRALKAEGARSLERLRQLQERLGEAATREQDLVRRLTTWEHEQALAADGDARLRRELQSLQAQRELYERQLAQVRDELERVARSLLDEDEPPALAVVQAA